MSRKPLNSKSGLDRIAVLNGDSASQYIKVCESSTVTEFKPGVYSRSVNDNGWTCPSGIDAVKTQGLVKSLAWTIRTIKKRASEGDAESQVILDNLDGIIKNAAQ